MKKLISVLLVICLLAGLLVPTLMAKQGKFDYKKRAQELNEERQARFNWYSQCSSLAGDEIIKEHNLSADLLFPNLKNDKFFLRRDRVYIADEEVLKSLNYEDEFFKGELQIEKISSAHLYGKEYTYVSYGGYVSLKEDMKKKFKSSFDEYRDWFLSQPIFSGM